MSASATYIKDPQATLDYGWDWKPLVREAPDDTIVDSLWTAPGPLLIERTAFAGLRTTVWLSGGQVGGDYLVTNRVTTAQGRVAECTFRMLIRDR